MTVLFADAQSSIVLSSWLKSKNRVHNSNSFIIASTDAVKVDHDGLQWCEKPAMGICNAVYTSSSGIK